MEHLAELELLVPPCGLGFQLSCQLRVRDPGPESRERDHHQRAAPLPRLRREVERLIDLRVPRVLKITREHADDFAGLAVQLYGPTDDRRVAAGMLLPGNTRLERAGHNPMRLSYGCRPLTQLVASG